MSISKIKKLKLETTAEYQPISELNVSFFNQDINTSVFDFIVTRNDTPIPLGPDNIEASIVLKSDKFKIQDEVQIKDGMNGIVTYTLPNEILERTGKVTGQIYIGVKGKEDTVVQRLFSFNIVDSLINSFDAETKLVYIRKFDQLEEQISQRVESIEQAIEHSEDYVTKVIEEKDIALSQIDASKISVLEEMTTLFDTEKSNLQAIGEGYKTNLEQVDAELNQKIEDIKQEISPETYVTQTQSDNWQKYKMTKDNGDVSDLPAESNISDPTFLDTLKPGDYYIPEPKGGPGESVSGFMSVKSHGTGAIKTITYKPHNEDTIYIKRFYQVWSEWAEVFVTNNSELIETTHGSQDKANVAENNAKVYTDSKVDEQHAVLFSGSVDGVGSSINLTSSLYDYNMIVISGSYFGGTIHETVLPAAIGPNVIIQRLNLSNTDGEIAFAYEMSMDVISGTKLTIARDVAHDMFNNVPSGPNKNAFTITRIEGFK